PTHDAYFSSVGQKTRNMIRRAGKEGFSFHDFAWNDYLDDIYANNTSKAVRSSGVMRGMNRCGRGSTQRMRCRFGNTRARDLCHDGFKLIEPAIEYGVRAMATPQYTDRFDRQ